MNGQAVDTLTVALPEIEVGALRSVAGRTSSPFSSSLRARSAQDIALQSGLSLEGVLQGLPGVWINDRGHFALGERLIIRGMGWRSAFGVRGVQVLLDGIPLTLPDGQGMLDIIDPAFIQTAEVIRGPASTFWGNGSGGVLMLSSSGFRDSTYVGIRAMTGSYGLNQLSAEAAVPVGRHRVHGFISRVENAGYRDYSAGSFVRSGMNGLFDLSPKSQLRIMLALAIQDTESPGGLTATQLEADPRAADQRNVNAKAGKESTQVQAGATFFRQTGAGLVSATVYALSRQLNNPLSFTYIDLGRRVGGGRVQLENERDSWGWSAGVDAAIQVDDRRNLNNDGGQAGSQVALDQRESVANVSAFAQGHRVIGRRIAASAGVRLDHIQFDLEDHITGNEALSGSRTFSAVSPSVGITYSTDFGQTFVNVSTAFETPTTTELVNQPDGSRGLNGQVGAQKTLGAEFGVRGSRGSLSYDLALFAMRITDRLLPFQDSEGRTYYRNAGENIHKGIEIALRRQVGVATDIQVTYTGSGFVFDDTALKGNRIPGIPVHHLVASINTQWSGFTGHVSANVVSDMFADDENIGTNSGYAVVDIRMGYPSLHVGGAEVFPFVNVSNVLDAGYVGSMVINAFGGRYFEPSPGRTVQVGVKVGF